MSTPKTFIPPTIGRVVLFHPAPRSGETNFVSHHEEGTPYAAIVAHVWTDKMVNLSVFDANGTAHSRTSVVLIQEGESAPDCAYCEWMPYQKGQAAKQDAQVKEANGPHISTHRQSLEQSAAHAVASRVAEIGCNGAKIGAEVREALDSLLKERSGAAPMVSLPVRDNHRNEDVVFRHPHSDCLRDARDIASDPAGKLCTSAEEPLHAAADAIMAAAGYRQLLDFGAALRALKDGQRVARRGWNGKGMWLALSCDGTREVPAAGFWAPANRKWAEQQPNGTAMVLPSITMKTATGEILMGWLASQTDMLAEDWVVVA